MGNDSCIFCKIANGEIPSRTIYQDEQFRVVLDINPASYGHALILPKTHYKDLFDLPENSAGEIMILAKKMSTYMRDKLKCHGINLLQNNGEAAGQTVFHYHLHLIPRYVDKEKILVWKPNTLEEKELEELESLLQLSK